MAVIVTELISELDQKDNRKQMSAYINHIDNVE